MRRSPILLALLALCACTAATHSHPLSDPLIEHPLIDVDNAEMIDLTWAFDDKTLYWPTSPSSFELKQLAYGQTPGGWFYSSNAFCTPEHGGTHLDAPIHFAAGKNTSDQIPLTDLIGPAVVIDISAKAAANADYRLTVDDIRAWEERNGEIEPATIVLLHTGWGTRWPDRKAYFGDDTPGAVDNLHFPSYGAEAARMLVNERHVSAIGVDTPSIDYGQSKDFIVHQIANGANVPGFENIAHLEEVVARGAWIIALPMKIAGGSGGPLRIVALQPRPLRK